ncbi:MAG: hypothetical protein WCA28_07765 [Bradyrhizobium sp.]
MQARERVANRQSEYESGGVVLIPFAPSPGSDAAGEGGVRSSLDPAYPWAARVEPTASRDAFSSSAFGRDAFGRSALLVSRIAHHEAAHVIVGAAMGSIIEQCTILPDDKFGGQTIRRGPVTEQFPEAEADDGPIKTSEEIVQIARTLAAMPPQFGRCRVAEAEAVVRLQVNVVELVAGTQAEVIFFPHLPPLDARHDEVEAAALASAICCATPDATEALVRYAKAEAVGLIEQNRDIITALADALVSRKTLYADDISAIIEDAVAARSQSACRGSAAR